MSESEEIAVARLPAIVLTIAVVIALVLGIATGSLNERIWNRPPPSPSDPITIP